MHPDDSLPDGAVRIPIRTRDGLIRAYAVVDAADAEWANRWRWRLDGKGYATRGERPGGVYVNIYLHRELLGLTRGRIDQQVDHIDRDKLNCRRTNLRIVSRAGNRQNVASYRGAASSHRGVSWNKGRGCWQGRVQIDGKSIFVGRFDDERQAAEAVKAVRLRLLPLAID